MRDAVRRQQERREELLATLEWLVSESQTYPVDEVAVYFQDGHRVELLRGVGVKEDLISLLMDKSLTCEIRGMRGWVQDYPPTTTTRLCIYLTGSDDVFLENTNIDSDAMELLGKVRFADEDI